MTNQDGKKLTFKIIEGKGGNVCIQHFLPNHDIFYPFNVSPNGNILDWSKLKAFAVDKINVAEMMISLSDRAENIVRKGENAGYRHFLLFPQCFQKPSISGSLNLGLCGKELKGIFIIRSKFNPCAVILCEFAVQD